MPKSKVFILFVLVWQVTVWGCVRIQHVDPQDLSEEQRVSLNDFSQFVKADLKVGLENPERLLAGCLQMRDFNFEEAAELLRQYLHFREEEQLDAILDEDWSEMRAKFPYTQDTVDKYGRPIFIDLGEWNFCEPALSSTASLEKLARYVHMIKEEMRRKMEKYFLKERQVAQFRYLGNAAGLTAEKHGCPQFGRFFQMVANKPDHVVPGDADKLRRPSAIIVNVPEHFMKIYSTFSAASKSATEIFGQDRVQWESRLLQEIEQDQIPKQIFKEIP